MSLALPPAQVGSPLATGEHARPDPVVGASRPKKAPDASGHFSQAFSYGLQNGLVCFAPAWFSILAVCLHTAPVENLRPSHPSPFAAPRLRNL
ncbi:protein of unknown function [Methylacidimicrobium sp. AP8]|nr:protein of unknown function [Methylacidimicrobium sp. AP8]